MSETTNQKQHIPELMSYTELAKYYSLKVGTITKLVMTGDFTNIVKIGRKNYFRKADVEAWIDSKTIKVVGV